MRKIKFGVPTTPRSLEGVHTSFSFINGETIKLEAPKLNPPKKKNSNTTFFLHTSNVLLYLALESFL